MTALLETKLVQEPLISRPYEKYGPSLWGDHFLSYVENQQEKKFYATEIIELKKIVKHSVLSTESSVTDKIILISNIERLGLAYHFEEEIDEQLKQIFHMNQENGDYGDDDLFIVSLKFRLLRQHGHNISSDIFQKFKDPKSGMFKESLKSDTKGVLSLYEAAYVRTKRDEILEEAVNFTTMHLKNFKENPTCPILLKEVEHALVQILHRSMPRLEARHYISIYEQLDLKNESLLKLAKLDYNLVQMLHKQELYDLSRWWKKMDIITKLGYPRNRLIESYFWSLVTYYEPQYSVARVMLAKVVAIISVTDDTFDSYGTIEELEVFNDAIQKWNVKEIDQLPNYMKIWYIEILLLLNHFEEELKEDDRPYAVNSVKRAMKQIIQAYFIEAKMVVEGNSPTFDEYLMNGLVTSCAYILVPASYLGVKDAKEEVFSWLSQNPQMLRSTAVIFRLVNDVSSYENEKSRGEHTPIECYMKEFGTNEEEACLKFTEMAEDAWKELNEEVLKLTHMPRKILRLVMNNARAMDIMYKYDEDAYTNPEKVLKHHIASLFIDPVPL